MKRYWFIIAISTCISAACGVQKKSGSNLNPNENLQIATKSEIVSNQKDLNFENTKWILKSIDGEEIEQLPNPAYIMFGDGDRVSGFSGCNGFGGSYYLSGDILKLDNMISTQKGCLNKNPEKLFNSVLSRVDACTVTGNKLIFTQMGKEIAVFEGMEQ